MLICVPDSLCAVAYSGLGEEPVDVRLDGCFADVQPTGNLAIGQPLGDQAQYVSLAGGQAVGKIAGDEFFGWAGLARGAGVRCAGGGYQAPLHLRVEYRLVGCRGPYRVGDLAAAGV